MITQAYIRHMKQVRDNGERIFLGKFWPDWAKSEYWPEQATPPNVYLIKFPDGTKKELMEFNK